ncbi:hypothetical protein VFDL14_22305 [Vibrio fortis]|uniref:Uncharacterized protein n=1 Tax=Vibrio fortis TaxID=212667 RepID=A0A066UST3_9VIBR|nr:hypothetical protein VFDL14_22305 [Vibrio fortis]
MNFSINSVGKTYQKKPEQKQCSKYQQKTDPKGPLIIVIELNRESGCLSERTNQRFASTNM